MDNIRGNYRRSIGDRLVVVALAIVKPFNPSNDGDCSCGIDIASLATTAITVFGHHEEQISGNVEPKWFDAGGGPW